MGKYSIGIDFGTLSARAIIVDVKGGKVIAASEFVYPHAVMDRALPDGTPLEAASAYQHPQDYIDALKHTLPAVISESGASLDDIVGICVDFTSPTLLPVDETGTPLCFFDEFKSEPHAYVKLWKHHSAQPEADEITAKAIASGEKWLQRYGGRVSSESIFPKILETLRKAPKVYEKAYRFIEAGDFITWLLIGENVSSSCMAGYKCMWNRETGYPSREFLKTLAPEFETIVGTKISENIKPTGTKAGEVNVYGSELTGLKLGTTVAVPIIDAHSSLPAAGIAEGGKLMLILGTSACHIIMDEEEKNVPGICGAVRDGIIPGLVAYEAGQNATGDIFDWFVKNSVPQSYTDAAEKENKSIFTYLTEKAEKLEVGESGLVAIDWWNGNRTPYADFALKGAIMGYTLQTRPEEMYRALIESTAFGTKAIVDIYVDNGVAINEIYATGGISQKNSFLMQIYADVIGKEIKVPDMKQAGAMGSAILAAFAGGGYDTVKAAVTGMVNVDVKTYRPNPENTEKYKPIYEEYRALSEFFAKRKK